MRFLAASILALVLVAQPAAAESAVSDATYPFSWNEHDLTGPGADHLRRAVRNAQFVLIGEEHHDRNTPQFARMLYAVLRREHGFSHLAVEQDPVGIEFVLAPGQRGNAAAIAAGLKKWPTLLGFASDQDLALLADAGASVAGPDAIWGVEQAQSPVRYLEELATLAPAGRAQDSVARLLDRARAEDRTRADFGKFLAYDRQTLPDLRRLDALWSPAKGTKARFLLDGLVRSAEIYDYYVRGKAEHDPALGYLNATVRETWLKAQFTRQYRAAARSGTYPRVLFKFGDNHIRRGVGTTGAWTLGTFAADLATFDGLDSVSMLVVPIGSDIPDWQHLPEELRPYLPRAAPPGPVLIDLTALRPIATELLQAAPSTSRDAARLLLFGFDAIVVLPHSAPATWQLTGFPTP